MRRSLTALALASLLAGCSAGADGPPPLRAEPARPGSASEAREEVRATIVRASIRVAESFPPQYFVDIVSALEDGCTKFSRTDLRREGATIFVAVFNTRPARDDVACTMIYGEKETAVALGSDFTPGESYVVDVNGRRETFVAQ
jgi:hypothetical protein